MSQSTDFDAIAMADIIAGQDGLVTYTQLVSVGFPVSTISYRVLLGRRWQRLLPGTYLTTTGTPTQRQYLRAALLYAGPESMLSGLAALELFGLRRLPRRSGVHVLVPAELQRSSSGTVAVERTSRLPVAVPLVGLSCAPLVRALVDAARHSTDEDAVRAMMAEAVQRNLCTPEAIAIEVRDGPIRHSGRARTVSREMAAGVRSAAEAWCRDALKRYGVPNPLWNVNLVDLASGEVIARPDALWPECCVIVEIDSREFHLSPVDWQRTQERHAKLTALGFVVLHFAPSRIRREPAAVCAQIMAALIVNTDRRWPASLVPVSP